MLRLFGRPDRPTVWDAATRRDRRWRDGESRRTHAARIEALRVEGVGEVDLARLCAPVGLDISARTPEETAISIAAKIVALQTGRRGGRLRGSALPVHGAMPATEKVIS